MRLQAATGNGPNQKTNFVWDVNQPLPQLALERNGNGNLLRQYIYGARRINQTASGTLSYFHYDPLGSVVDLTSSTGVTQHWWSYEPYGTIFTAAGTLANSLMLYTGEYQDPTGLYHLRARQYDPTSGRFLAVDPIENLRGYAESRYAYVSERPTVLVDPTGRVAQPTRSTYSVMTLRIASTPSPVPEPRQKWYSIPRWGRLGSYYGGFFIQRPSLCPFETPVGDFGIPPFAPCLRGDGGGFSSTAARETYRAFMDIDFSLGILYLRVNASCRTDGRCFYAHEIEGFRSWWDPRDFPDRANKFGVRSSPTKLDLKWSLTNSAFQLPARAIPSIDGSMSIARTGAITLDLDGFPSFELYRRAPVSRNITCLEEKPESSPLAIFLPPVFGLDEGRSRC